MTTLEQNFMEAVTRYCKEHTHKEIDWEKRRYEIARELLATRDYYSPRDAVEMADALIEELRDTIMRLLIKRDKDYLIDTIRELVDSDEDAKSYTGLDGLLYTEIKL